MEQIVTSQPGPGLRRDSRGSTLIEMAVILPVFFMLLFGLFRFAQIGYGYNNLTYAVREAARYGSVHSATSVAPATTAAMQNIVLPYMNGTGANQSPANCPGNNCFTVAYTGSKSVGNSIGNTVTVTGGMYYCVVVPLYPSNCFVVLASDARTIIR
jgi:Flp pilus assembly protein TadG